MILQLDERHRLFGGERAWELQSLKVVKGRSEWRSYKWFPTLDSALREAARAEIRTEPVQGLVEAIGAADRVIAKYSAIIDGAADEIAAKLKRVAA